MPMTSWMQGAAHLQTVAPQGMVYGQQGPSARGRRRVPTGKIHAVGPADDLAICGAGRMHVLDRAWPPSGIADPCAACESLTAAKTAGQP